MQTPGEPSGTTICSSCREPITATDAVSSARLDGQQMHYECGLRMVIGSVGHLQRKCSCYGGTMEDPEGMTLRQAAQAAFELWKTLS